MNSVIEKEKTLGTLQAEGMQARLEELKKMSALEVSAIGKQLDRVLKATENLDSAPSELGIVAAPTQTKQLGRAHTAQDLDMIREGSNRKILEMMRAAQEG